MTKLIDLNTPALPVAATSGPEFDSVRRLLVVVPSREPDPVLMTSRIWEVANATGSRVQFVGLCSDPVEEPGLRRALVTMSAMLNSTPLVAEVETVVGKDWVEAIRSRWQAGDLVVCPADVRIGFSRRTLSQVLQSGLDAPLYVLTGIYPQSDLRPGWQARAAAWTGSIAILLGFFILQARLGDFAGGWTTTLQLLSIPLEAWSIWAWNRLFG